MDLAGIDKQNTLLDQPQGIGYYQCYCKKYGGITKLLDKNDFCWDY